jgi:formylglycine-generating enzyme required for sulfatase activity
VISAYRERYDPGVHSAAEWLLRRWQMAERLAPIDRELIKRGTLPGLPLAQITKPWCYVNGQGQTFAVIPAPGKFTIGSPPDEKGKIGRDEDRRQVQIDYSFAVATKLVTVAEFKKCLPAFQHEKQISPGEDTPINRVNWYDAARYCNWLSEQEKIPKDQWCYEPNGQGEYAVGMKVKANYQSLAGYRLPQEAEWEYACRAGTVTAWSHGSDEAMLGHYAWYQVNTNATMHPVGTRKPNGLGLFDVHGNAAQWCQNIDVEQGDKDIDDGMTHRVLRGGSFIDAARGVRSAARGLNEPGNRFIDGGFRVARTYR